MFLRSLPNFAATILLAGSLALAQTPLTFSNFTEESLITQDQLTSPDAPALPDDLVSAVQGGQIELHQMLSYNAAQATLTVALISLPTGSPIPSPAGVSGNPVYTYVVSVKSITATETAAVLNGVITSSQGAGGLVAGSLMTVTTGFTVQAPDASGTLNAIFNTVDVSIAGIGSLNAKSGAGSLKLGAGAAKLPVAVAGPKGQEVFTPSFALSGTGSTDPNGGTLIYQWALIPAAGQSVTLQNASTAAPVVTIADDGTGAAYGLYTFQLTVTNAAGLSSIDTVTIDYESGQ